jgi:hypothetical protein
LEEYYFEENKLLSPSEEVTKTWIKRKGILINSRPQPSRFSFFVCLAIVFSIAFGFLGGFITAGFALNENYSTVYENLLTELETTKQCLEREKKKLQAGQQNPMPPENIVSHASARNVPLNRQNSQVREQALIGVFGHAIELLKENDINGGCAQLKNIINLPKEYNGEWQKWKTKAQYLLNKNCR